MAAMARPRSAPSARLSEEIVSQQFMYLSNDYIRREISPREAEAWVEYWESVVTIAPPRDEVNIFKTISPSRYPYD